MYEKIELSQRFDIDDYLFESTFEIDVIKKQAVFKKVEFINMGESDYNSDFLQKAKNMLNKPIKLYTRQIDLIFDEIKKLRIAEFSLHDFRINSNIKYGITLFEGGYISNWININLQYQKELVEFSNFLKNIFGFQVFDLTFLERTVTLSEYNIKRSGIYSKDTHKKLRLKRIDFDLSSSIAINSENRWILDFDKKILKTVKGSYNLDDTTISIVNGLIEDFGVYNWHYRGYYRKIDNNEELLRDGPGLKIRLTFESGRQLSFHIRGYPDTYPQLAFKVKELFGLDLLRCDYPIDLDLYYKYGDKKICFNK